MKTVTAKIPTYEDGRDAIVYLKAGAQKVASRSLPVVASAAEHAGQRVSKLATAASHRISHSAVARRVRPSKSDRLMTGLAALPLLRTASRFAVRNPAVIAAAGAAVAMIGYLAWRRSAEQGHEPDPLQQEV